MYTIGKDGFAHRGFVKPLEDNEIIEILGENHFQNTMAVIGWTAYRAPKQLDYRKIDMVCRNNEALIDVQLKCSNFNEKACFNWNVYGNDNNLDLRFYDQRHTFLCLVGVDLFIDTDQNRNFQRLGLMKAHFSFPWLGLIPGREVVKRFEGRKSGGISLSFDQIIYRNDQWDKYFGEDLIIKTLKEDLESQKRENEILEGLANGKLSMVEKK